MFMSLLPLILIFAIFYFLLIRPQQTKMKQHRTMLENLKKGDQIVTAGGVVGKVVRIEQSDNQLMVEIAPNVQVKVIRQTVADLLTKPVPASGNDNRARRRRLPAAFSASCWARSKPRRPCSRLPPGARWSWPPSACSAFSPSCRTSLAESVRRSLPGWLPNRADHARPRPAGRLLPSARGRCRRRCSQERLESMVGDVRAGLRAARIGYRGLGVQGETVALTLTDPAQRDQALAEIDKLNPVAMGAAGPDSRLRRRVTRRGGSCCGSPRPSASICASPRSTSRSRWCAAASTSSARARPRSSARARTGSWSRCPGEKNPENIKRLLGRTARLTFHMVDLGASVQEALQGRVPPGSMLLESAERDGRQLLALRRQAPGRAQRREPDRRAALVPGQPARGELPVRQCRSAQVRQDHPGECRQAVRDRARRQGDLGPQHPRADPGRLGHHLRQLHRRIGQRAVGAAARRRPAGPAQGDRGALGRGRAGRRLRSAPARSPASWPRCS